jgi:hypothetical protein
MPGLKSWSARPFPVRKSRNARILDRNGGHHRWPCLLLWQRAARLPTADIPGVPTSTAGTRPDTRCEAYGLSLALNLRVAFLQGNRVEHDQPRNPAHTAKTMKLDLYKLVTIPATPGGPHCTDRGRRRDVVPDDVQLVLSPHHPTLDITEAEVGERPVTTEVLHVRIQRADGKIAHLHFSVGINNQGRPFGEIAAMHDTPQKQVVRKATAGWREPVKRS